LTALVVFCLVVLAPALMQAQTTNATGIPPTIVDSGFGLPQGVAVDSNGNIYVADNLGEVLKETPSGGAYIRSVLPIKGLSNPYGIAIDSSGNLYIADEGNNRVMKETLSDGSYSQSTIGINVVSPRGVAVDKNGNVYITSKGQIPNTGSDDVYQETPSRGSYTESVFVEGLSNPQGVAVDSSGNVYIADTGNSRVLKETLLGGTNKQTIVVYGDVNSPSGVTVDSDGNLYVADTNNNRILKGTLSGDSYTPSTITDGLNAPLGVAVDSNDTLYIADTQNQRVLRLQTKEGFTLTSTSTTLQSLYPGSAAATYSFAITPLAGNYPNLVTLSVSGLPAGFTAKFNPATVTPGTSTVSSQLVIQNTASALAQRERRGSLPCEAIAACLLLPLLGVRRLRCNRSTHLLALCLLGAGLLATLGIGGCGKGIAPGVTAGYTVTVMATSGSLVHSTTVTLNVVP
jgi:sugar lactone lactonase YvrE